MGTRGLELLWRAKFYSEQVESDTWQFGVEMSALLEGGLSVTDIRWLIAKGYAAHAREATRVTHRTRQFLQLKALHFPPGTCVVLTALGVDAVKQLLAASPDVCVEPSRDASPVPAQPSPHQRQPTRTPIMHRRKGPSWNADLHELRMDGRLVKHFKRPAASQELILAAFEEESWPDGVDDPLPMTHGIDSKHRLHFTVHHLNRGQRPFLIRFSVNGHGQRVYWRSARHRQANSARRVRKER
jgi:hypothetical protein